MLFSANSIKWIMRVYPPLLFNGIWIKNISPDFLKAEVKVSKSLLNTNFNGSIFGGTIYSAADPFYSILIWGIFSIRGYKVRVWLKSAQIHFLKPARSTLFLNFELSSDEVQNAVYELNQIGKYIHLFSIEIVDKLGEVYAIMQTEVYAINLQTVNNEHKKTDSGR